MVKLNSQSIELNSVLKIIGSSAQLNSVKIALFASRRSDHIRYMVVRVYMLVQGLVKYGWGFNIHSCLC